MKCNTLIIPLAGGPVGMQVLDHGRTWTAAKVAPHTDRAGNPTLLITWVAMDESGEVLEHVTGRKIWNSFPRPATAPQAPPWRQPLAEAVVEARGYGEITHRTLTRRAAPVRLGDTRPDKVRYDAVRHQVERALHALTAAGVLRHVRHRVADFSPAFIALSDEEAMARVLDIIQPKRRLTASEDDDR